MRTLRVPCCGLMALWLLLRFEGLKHYHLPVVITQKTTCHTSTSGLAGTPAVLPVAIPPIGRKGQGRRTQGNTELRFRRHSFHLQLIYPVRRAVDRPAGLYSLACRELSISFITIIFMLVKHVKTITILFMLLRDISFQKQLPEEFGGELTSSKRLAFRHWALAPKIDHLCPSGCPSGDVPGVYREPPFPGRTRRNAIAPASGLTGGEGRIILLSVGYCPLKSHS